MACKSYFSVISRSRSANNGAIFHCMIMLCTIQNDGMKQKLSAVRQYLVTVLNIQCKCDLTMSHISQSEFSCRTGPDESVTFRARISGTSSRSASDLASLIRTWVQGRGASIKVGTARLQLDSTCDASLENIHAPDCVEKPTDEPAKTSTKTPTKTPTEEPTQDGVTGKTQNGDNGGNGGISSGDTVGILFGGIIAGLLLALLIVTIIIIVMLMKKIKSQS